MRNGRLLPDGSPDDVVKGSKRDPSLFGEPEDDEPVETDSREEPRERAAQSA
jgi:5-methyltetrahydrofolate--homocysteine methyltransferase